MRSAVIVFAVNLALLSALFGQDKLAREIYVPFDDLNVLLEGQTQRVFLTRKEYEELLAKAKLSPAKHLPLAAAILAADYTAVAEEGRLALSGKLEIEVLAEGLTSLPLELSGVGVRAAELDGRPASIVNLPGQPPFLVASGVGKKQLALEITAPLESAAAVQTLQFQVPVPASTRFKLSVPGNVEIKSGADVASRVVDAAAGVTRFEILPKRGANQIVMSLNNRLLLEQRAVVARSVLVDEITTTQERLGATISLGILHGAVDRFRFAIPADFEVAEVESALLSRWSVESVEGKQILHVQLREATTDTVVIHASLVRAAPLVAWTFPKLEPLDVVGQVAVVGLLVEERLKPRRLTSEGLLPINVDDLAAALPPSVATRDARSAVVRPVAAWYAPQSAYKIGAEFADVPAALAVVSSVLLELSDQGEKVKGVFRLSPSGERVFSVEFIAPPGWQVVEATGGKPGENSPIKLPIETFAAAERGSRVQLRLPQGVTPGETYEVKFQAESTSPGWLSAWASREVAVPVFAISGVKRDQGAVSIRALDDLEVRPDKLSGLVPLDDTDRTRFGLAGVETNLAFRYENHPYSAALVVERRQPVVSARSFSFFRVSPEGLAADYELLFDVREASARRLAFRLPASTPGEVSIRGVAETVVKETSSEVKDDQRVWTVLLAGKVPLTSDEFGNRTGAARLAVRFEQPLAKAEPKDWKLPLIKADSVTYQSGFAAVEGSPDLDIEIKSHPRKADVGDLAAAEHQPGRRLLGVFGYLGEKEEVSLNVSRHTGYGLPAAIVERAELVTLVSASGTAQTAARYRLRSKALFLEVELPADAKLWSALLDARPLSPQVEGDKLLLSLPSGSASAVRDVQLVYESPVAVFRIRGHLETAAPRLYLRADAESERREVPTAELVWHLHVPSGYRVVHANGTVYSGEIARRKIPGSTALVAARDSANVLASALTPIQAAREAARRPGATFSVAPDSIKADFSQGESITAEGGIAGFKGKYGDLGPDSAPAEPMVNAPPLVHAPTPAKPEAPMEPSPDPNPSAAIGLQTPATPPPTTAPDDRIVTSGKDGDFETGKWGDRGGEYWALEGWRSLAIKLRPEGDPYTFQSLGVEPRLAVTLVDSRRFNYLAWGTVLLVFAYGLTLSKQAWTVRLRYVVILLLAAWLLPLVGGNWAEIDDACDLTVCAVFVLSVYYMGASVWQWLGRRRASSAATTPAVAASIMLAMLIAGAASTALGQDKGDEIEQSNPVPLAVPPDAIIIPYDPEAKDGVKSAEKVLVPYEKYTELWSRAYPDQPREKKLPPAPFALAGSAFEARLAGDDYLTVTGRVNIDVLGEGTVEIPLPFSGGVLSEATLDGKPARLRVIAAAPPADGKSAPAGETLLVLYASGIGRKQLSVSIRLPLTRQGGWRIAEGRLPAGLVAALTLRVPEGSTEIRLRGVVDKTAHETKAANETIETSLAVEAPVHIEWRPKVAAAEVDRGLTVRSAARLDVREDGLRLAWQLAFEFPRGRRESFVVGVPEGYLVERVTGGNVRGWQQKGEGKQLEITLLKAAIDSESLTLHLSRRGAVGQGETTKIEAPLVTVEGAALQQGMLAIRRSEALDVRTTATAGVSRTDNAEMAALDAREAEETSPLPLRPFQSYRFASIPFSVSLEAASVVVSASAEVQTLVHVAERESALVARLRYRATEGALHRLRVEIPSELEIERLEAPGTPEWTVTDEEGKRVLTVYLPAGARGEFVVAFTGSLGKRAAADALPLPSLVVLDVMRQQGEIAVLADVAFAVSTEDLVNCDSILLERAHGWITLPERELLRHVLAYRSGDYAGTLKLAKKTPRVTGYTISNVRVSSRTVEETIFLEFQIEDGGLRAFTFQLPERLKDARIRAKNLKQITRKPIVGPGAKVNAKDANKLDATTLPAVNVWLELQDEARGRFQVIVEHDRLRSEGVQEVPLTMLETGQIERRFVVLENASADELVVDGTHGFEPLERRQQGWQELAAVLGENITSAYVARENSELRRLAFHLKQRAAVETAAAKIGLAETRLMLDGSGAYRAAVVFRVNNRTEQFLEIELPAGAELWTARVAGAAVKPAALPGARSDRFVRVPLVKTEEGDDDYEVIFKYGGRLPEISSWSSVSFPLLVASNINVETSQVRLYLPESHAWFNFGGKMRYAASEDDLRAGYLAYRTRQIEQLTQSLSSSNPYSRMRSQNNLKQIGMGLRSFAESAQTAENEALQKESASNLAAIHAAEAKVAAQEAQQRVLADGADNRGKLNERWNLQTQTESSGRAQSLDAPRVLLYNGQQATPSDGSSNTVFNREWLGKNKLDDNAGKSSQVWDDLKKKGQKDGNQQPGDAKFGEDRPAQPALSNVEGSGEGQQPDKAESKPGTQRGRAGEQDRESTERYQQRLEAQQGQAVQPGQALPGRYLDKEIEYPNVPIRHGDFTARAPQFGGFDATTGASAAGVGGPPAADAAYLASLDVEFPERGEVYRFTTPRGEVEITARAIAAPLVSRLIRAGAVVGVLLAAVLVVRLRRKRVA